VRNDEYDRNSLTLSAVEDKVVYLTMTYDYTDGKLPADYLDLVCRFRKKPRFSVDSDSHIQKPIWFDVDQCGMSEVHPPKDDGNFTVTAKAWHPNFEGEMIGLGGVSLLFHFISHY
jgi:hypothetical protein